MTRASVKVLTTVNAPYGAKLSAYQLADKIVDPESACIFDASVFAFFSEVSPSLQRAFVEDMGVDKTKVQQVASAFAAKCGFRLALAAST